MNRIRYFMTLADSITLNESTLKLTHNTYTQDIMANQSKMPLQSGVASRRPTITNATAIRRGQSPSDHHQSHWTGKLLARFVACVCAESMPRLFGNLSSPTQSEDT